MRRFLLLLFISQAFALNFACAQRWIASLLADMPMSISNNAVTAASVNGVKHVFSFAGIDSTKIWSGVLLNSFRYNTITNNWDTISSLPDTQGKIACGASTVKNLIYIIGGYHVAQNGNETSSVKVHIYDPENNLYLPDGADIPLAIDDHVQAVWRDSLIFVVTGWSNTSNRPNVQIYDPALDSWTVGTAVPNTNVYKSFGASGSISGDTLYYYGGASMAGAFNIQNNLRMGVIDPTDPTQITWSNPQNFSGVPGYRMASTVDHNGDLHWIGGSGLTYNYNGIAYNGSGGVSPLKHSLFVPVDCISCFDTFYVDVPMDLRGIAEISNVFPPTRIIAGGMKDNQEVSSETILLTYQLNTAINDVKTRDRSPVLFPNPALDVISVSYFESEYECIIYNISGIELMRVHSAGYDCNINLAVLPFGMFLLRVVDEDQLYNLPFIHMNE